MKPLTIVIPVAIVLLIIWVVFVTPPCKGDYRIQLGGDKYFLFECKDQQKPKPLTEKAPALTPKPLAEEAPTLTPKPFTQEAPTTKPSSCEATKFNDCYRTTCKVTTDNPSYWIPEYGIMVNLHAIDIDGGTRVGYFKNTLELAGPHTQWDSTLGKQIKNEIVGADGNLRVVRLMPSKVTAYDEPPFRPHFYKGEVDFNLDIKCSTKN